ncbi:MAG: NADPH-dependent reductase [Acidobacteria bacterium]|nr:NADPH-dependent reductase [Acidobacteriota bacterium]
MRVLGIAGSLRRASYNRALLDAARQLAPEGVSIDRFDLDRIPLYNADLDVDDQRPDEVGRLKAAVSAADALLIVTPEYNHSVPGVLQNAIDWVSRPGMKSPLAGKPIGIMCASTSVIGGARAQQQLKLVLLGTLSLVMPHAGVLVGQAPEKFDNAGTLTHEPTRQFVAAYLTALEAWTRRVGTPATAQS